MSIKTNLTSKLRAELREHFNCSNKQLKKIGAVEIVERVVKSDQSLFSHLAYYYRTHHMDPRFIWQLDSEGRATDIKPDIIKLESFTHLSPLGDIKCGVIFRTKHGKLGAAGIINDEPCHGCPAPNNFHGFKRSAYQAVVMLLA